MLFANYPNENGTEQFDIWLKESYLGFHKHYILAAHFPSLFYFDILVGSGVCHLLSGLLTEGFV